MDLDGKLFGDEPIAYVQDAAVSVKFDGVGVDHLHVVDCLVLQCGGESRRPDRCDQNPFQILEAVVHQADLSVGIDLIRCNLEGVENDLSDAIVGRDGTEILLVQRSIIVQLRCTRLQLVADTDGLIIKNAAIQDHRYPGGAIQAFDHLGAD